MTLRLSTALRQQLMGVPVTITSTAILVPAGAASYEITGGTTFHTEGFRPGMIVKASSFANDENNVYSLVTLVATDGLELTVTVSAANQLVAVAASPSVTILATAQSFKDVFTYGVMCIYTGSQPADADTAPTGTKLLEISKGSAAFAAGNPANSLEFDAPVAGVLGKKDADTWSDTGIQSGTAGWFRFYANDFDVAASGLCFDGSVATSGAQLNLSSTAIVLDATTTIDEFEITLPASA